ncbi:hypothetical protein FACS1894202_01110 [Clostridia bacterium]|nr:hypothetical protein FACS1894202_01110 [Clostridia bacterium]
MNNAYNAGVGAYGRSLIVDEFNDDVIEHARSVFGEYKSRGIMLNESFDDDGWLIDDEKTRTGLMRFPVSAVAGWIGSTPTEYRRYVKAYIALKFGELSSYSLREISRELLKISARTLFETTENSKFANHISDFLQLLPGGNAERDYVIERMSEKASTERRSGIGQQRVLADFQSYLNFNDALTDFWALAGADEKRCYFPLYFWWNLTAILPLRVTEFLLTPRDCLNGNTLSIRRTKLKGGNVKVNYRVAEDYEIFEYKIADALASELREYIAATDEFSSTHIETLFRTEQHDDYPGAISGQHNRYYTYNNLNACFNGFTEIYCSPGDTSQLHLGDTRHIAMINLIIAGGSPTVCRELAGHANIDVSSHYYSNISTLVECATLARLRKNRGGDEAVIDGTAKFSVTKPKNAQPVTGGLCASEAFARRDIDDCLKVIGANGEIGDCTRCQHYHPDDEGLRVEFTNPAAAKAAVDADSAFLMQMVELVRKGLGYDEDIGTALLKLQHSAYHYSMCIREKVDYGAA